MSSLISILKLFFSSGLMQALNFLLVIVLSNYYNNNIVADYSKIAALIGFSSVFIEFGCNQLIISRSDKNQLIEILKIRIYSLFAYLLIYVFLINYIFKIYDVDLLYKNVFIFYVLTLSFCSSISFYFQGKGYLNLFNAFQYGRGVTHFLLSIVFIFYLKNEFPIYSWLVIGLIVNILFIVFSIPMIPKKIYNYKGVTWSHAINYFVASVSVMIILRCDALFLGAVSNHELAIFFQAKTIALVISLLSTSISNYYMVNIKKYALLPWGEYKRNVMKVLYLAIPVGGIVMIFSLFIMPFIYNKSYSPNMSYIYVILSFSYMLGLIINPLSVLILRAEKSFFSLKLNVTQAISTIIFSYLFLNYGGIGLAFAVSISYIISLFIVVIYVRNNYDLFVSKIME